LAKESNTWYFRDAKPSRKFTCFPGSAPFADYWVLADFEGDGITWSGIDHDTGETVATVVCGECPGLVCPGTPSEMWLHVDLFGDVTAFVELVLLQEGCVWYGEFIDPTYGFFSARVDWAGYDSTITVMWEETEIVLAFDNVVTCEGQVTNWSTPELIELPAPFGTTFVGATMNAPF